MSFHVSRVTSDSYNNGHRSDDFEVLFDAVLEVGPFLKNFCVVANEK